jgi:hypothetical protein
MYQFVACSGRGMDTFVVLLLGLGNVKSEENVLQIKCVLREEIFL